MILKARAEKGSLSSALRSSMSSGWFGRCPSVGGRSSGLGRKSTTASSMGCTPLFLKADPHRTGTTAAASVAVRRARRRSTAVMGSSARYFSMMVSSKLDTTSMSWWRASSASAARFSGMSRVSHSSPMSEDQTRAFSSSRSTTPLNSDSAPMGS